LFSLQQDGMAVLLVLQKTVYLTTD